MSLHRLTLLPQPESATPAVSRVVVPAPDVPPVDVQSIARIAQGGRWRTEAMRSYDRPVLMWFTRGQGRFSISGRTCGYNPHNLVFLPPRTMHGFSTMGPVLGSVVFLPRDESYDWPAEAIHLRLHESQLQRELTAMVDAMSREVASKCERSNMALAHHAGLLSVWLSRTAEAYADAPNPSPGTRVDTAAHRMAQAFTSLVERDFRRPEGVQHYAALLGVTPTHLTRVCRQVSGRAALDILTDRRHFEARRLLRDSKLQISDIARQSGFASPAYFTRAFRNRTGQSPSEFRHAS
jgi:AraC family transcriptional regulator, transcriptional activator of pobA